MLNPSKLAIGLEREGEEPIYRQLIRHIRAQIESGILSAGTRLPASRDLAQQLNISRIISRSERSGVVGASWVLVLECPFWLSVGCGALLASPAMNVPRPAWALRKPSARSSA